MRIIFMQGTTQTQA